MTPALRSERRPTHRTGESPRRMADRLWALGGGREAFLERQDAWEKANQQDEFPPYLVFFGYPV